MIFFLNYDGSTQLINPNNIYRGTTAMDIIAFTPFPNGLIPVQCGFVLPDGTVTEYIPMQYIPNSDYVPTIDPTKEYAPIGIYKLALSDIPTSIPNILGQSGELSICFAMTLENGTQTSYLATVQVEETILPELPDSPNEDVYDLMRQYILTNSEAIGLLENRVTTIEEKHFTVVKVAEEAQDEISFSSNPQGQLDNKYNKAETYNKTEVDASQALKADKSDTYTKSEVDSKNASLQNQINDNTSDIIETKTEIGSEDISAIASNVKLALISMNEDIDSLQLGVVPRTIRGIVFADTNYGKLTDEIRELLTAEVLKQTGRTVPDNTDAVQLMDTSGIDVNIMYTYYYWSSEVSSDLDGWYLAYSALSQTINNNPCYTLNFNDSAWAMGEDGYYHITVEAATHELGTDNTLKIGLLKLVDGVYEPITQYTVSGTGTVDIYTDELFTGTLIISVGKSFIMPTLLAEKSQIIGLEDDLSTLTNAVDTNTTAIATNTTAIATNTTAIATKVDKIEGKELSTNDFTTELMNKIGTNGNDIELLIGRLRLGKIRVSETGNCVLPVHMYFGGAAYGDGLWVVCGSTGNNYGSNSNYVATSPDGITWTQRDISDDTAYTDRVAYGNGLWIINNKSASTGNIFTSPDGITWTQHTVTSQSYAYFNSMIYENDLWVIGGSDGNIFTSPDGITWTSRTSGFGTSTITDIAYGNGLYVAVGGSGKIATSPDGITWTLRTSEFGTTTINSVAYGDGLWVMVGDSRKIATSPDGITWTLRANSFGANQIESVAYGDGLWVIGGNDYVATSPDGITWTTFKNSFSFIKYVAYGHFLWIICGIDAIGIATPAI